MKWEEIPPFPSGLASINAAFFYGWKWRVDPLALAHYFFPLCFLCVLWVLLVLFVSKRKPEWTETISGRMQGSVYPGHLQGEHRGGWRIGMGRAICIQCLFVTWILNYAKIVLNKRKKPQISAEPKADTIVEEGNFFFLLLFNYLVSAAFVTINTFNIFFFSLTDWRSHNTQHFQGCNQHLQCPRLIRIPGTRNGGAASLPNVTWPYALQNRASYHAPCFRGALPRSVSPFLPSSPPVAIKEKAETPAVSAFFFLFFFFFFSSLFPVLCVHLCLGCLL